jgi:hypothetical protein
MKEIIITKEYLKQHPNEIFVFGDNTIREGMGGAAMLRYEKNVYGFITKKFPSGRDSDFYNVDEYKKVYNDELEKLIIEIKTHSNHIYLISKLGAGLANKYNIWEKVIEPNIKKDLKVFKNVKFLWE